MNKIYTTIFLLLALTCSSQITIVLQPGLEGKDAQIWSINPDNNYGNSPSFKVFGWTHSGVPGINRALIDFDLSVIPDSSFIIDARLNLYFVCLEPTYFGHTGNNASYLQLVTEPWEENAVSWNTQPEVTTLDQVLFPQSTDPYQDYLDIDVTAAINHLYSEPENYHGLMLRLIDETPYNCLMFASSDYEDVPEMRPMLEITYIGCQPPSVSFEYEVTGLSVAFSGASPTATSWHWDFGDGDTSILQNPVHTYPVMGNYQVCLRVEDTCHFATYCEDVDL